MMSVGEEAEEIFEPSLFLNTSYEIETVEIADVAIQLYALHSSATTDYDLTGQIVWPAAKLLACYLATHGDVCQHSSILELGAGSGLAGLVASKLSDDASRIVLTDNNDLVLDLLRKNIDVNFAGTASKPRCEHLSWGTEEAEDFISRHGTYDLIIGADVVFWPEAVPLLFQTVQKLLVHKPCAKFILSYINRSNYTTKILFQEAELNNLAYEKFDLNDDIYRRILASNKLGEDNANLFVFVRRQ